MVVVVYVVTVILVVVAIVYVTVVDVVVGDDNQLIMLLFVVSVLRVLATLDATYLAKIVISQFRSQLTTTYKGLQVLLIDQVALTFELWPVLHTRA